MPTDGQQWVQRPPSPSRLQICTETDFLNQLPHYQAVRGLSSPTVGLFRHPPGSAERKEQDFERKHTFLFSQ